MYLSTYICTYTRDLEARESSAVVLRTLLLLICVENLLSTVMLQMNPSSGKHSYKIMEEIPTL
jgi:hypothetical protein